MNQEELFSEPISEEDKEKISSLAKEAVGFNGDRGDSIVVTSGDFIEEMDLISTKWYEESWFQNVIGQISTVLILAYTFGALKPLLNRILVPSAGVQCGARNVRSRPRTRGSRGRVEVQEGESIEDIKAKLKPRKLQSPVKCLILLIHMMIK